MTLEQFFLGCFTFGFLFSLIALMAGYAHLHFHMGHGHIHSGGGLHKGSGVSKFNFGTIAAFLTWFGGAGYILSSWGRIGLLLILTVAIAIGLVGAVIIFVFVARIVAPGDIPLDPADYRMIGALGKVSSPILPK